MSFPHVSRGNLPHIYGFPIKTFGNDRTYFGIINNMKYIILSLFIFLISCDNKPQPSQKEVAHLYVDILVAEETYKTNIDSMKFALDSLYKFHNITEETYTSSLADYKNDEDTWNGFFDIATEYLDTLKAVEKRK